MNTSTPVPLQLAVVICLTVLALAAGAAVATLAVTGHAGDAALVVAAIGPIIGSVVSFAGAAKATTAAQVVATTAQAQVAESAAQVTASVQKLSNGGLDPAVRQSLERIQTAAVQGAPPNVPS